MDPEIDAFRRPVPPRLSPVFAGRRRLKKFRQELRRLLRYLATLEKLDGVVEIDFATMRRAILTACTVLERGMPAAACDCSANDDCPDCKSRRWLTASEHAAKVGISQSASLGGC